MATEDAQSAEFTEHEMRILEARARALATMEESDGDGEQMLQLVTFPLAGERYGIEAVMVQEVQPLRDRRWALVPCAPDFIVGAVNIRGHIRSIMDIALLLGLPQRPLPETAYVMLVRSGEGEMELCILADGVPEMEQIPQTDVKPNTATISAATEAYISGVTEDMLVVLDVNRLLADERIIVQDAAGERGERE